MRRSVSILVAGLFAGLVAGCAPAAPVAPWVEWGMTDAEATARSAGALSPARLEEPDHLQVEEPQFVSKGRIRQGDRWFDAAFVFDPRERRLHRIALSLSDADGCARLLDETLARRGRPDRLLKGSRQGLGGMYVWDGPGGVMLNYRPRFSDCVLIYSAPTRR